MYSKLHKRERNAITWDESILIALCWNQFGKIICTRIKADMKIIDEVIVGVCRLIFLWPIKCLVKMVER